MHMLWNWGVEFGDNLMGVDVNFDARCEVGMMSTRSTRLASLSLYIHQTMR